MHKMQPLKPAQHLILLLLVEKPSWGVELLERLEVRSRGTVRLNPGSLYRLIAQLVDGGLLRPLADASDAGGPGAPRKRYRVTRAGRAVLRSEARRQVEWVALARSLDLVDGPE
jgi:PadR family transcriptional regulator